MTFQEKMKSKRELAIERASTFSEDSSLEEKANEIIEDYIIPMIRLDLLFNRSLPIWNVEFHQNSNKKWCHGSASDGIELPFSTEALIEATKKASDYGIIGINRYDSNGYFGFTLLLVDESEIQTTYERVRFLDKS